MGTVRDGATVRAITPESRPAVVGRALAWSANVPRIVRAEGDTVLVPLNARLELMTRADRGHGRLGAIAGLGVGITISLLRCRPLRRTCGEQDVTPMALAALGGLIGLGLRSPEWSPVDRPD